MSSTVCSFEGQPKRPLSLSASQDYVSFATSKHLSKIKQRKSVIGKMNKLGERMECLAQGIREHVSLSPKLTETVKGKLSLGAKILQVGEDIQAEAFSSSLPIRLLSAVRSIKLISPTRKLLRIYYKVSIPISKIMKAKESENREKPPQKMILSSDHLPSATSKHLSKIKQRKSVISKMNKLGERMDCLAQGIREHVSLSPKLTETLKGKLSLGAKILQVGGLEKIFKQKFSVKDDEELLNVSQCYLSTTAGPIAGLLFISTDKIAFCSDRSIKFLSPTGKLLRIYYKVSIPISKTMKAKESENREKPSQKYVQVITEDDFEFWFMGFLNHQKTLRYLHHAISSTSSS
ncbi:hypothetical protein KY289_022272 [Solanum tuberosum]|nr:hypothetical protein KY289_022272 [Solanum tuberosum]